MRAAWEKGAEQRAEEAAPAQELSIPCVRARVFKKDESRGKGRCG
jgi:hypothetical protein